MSAITSDLYASSEVADLPTAAVLASFGCGNPTPLAELKPGETVLDLGSGGGIDVLLSASRVTFVAERATCLSRMRTRPSPPNRPARRWTTSYRR
jgi:hypothetical protein